MSYEVHGECAKHEGGTKYYQVIRITDQDTKAGIVVTHWGRWHEGAPSEPRLHGQCKVECLASGVSTRYRAAQNNKSKRGYKGWWTTIAPRVIASDADLENYLKHLLPPLEAKHAMDHFDGFVDMDEGGPFADESDTPVGADVLLDVIEPPKPKPEPVAAEPDHEEWGTW